MKKEVKCCICHKEQIIKPIRLIKQVYGLGKYRQYYQAEKYDICASCYKIFERWIEKHKII